MMCYDVCFCPSEPRSALTAVGVFLASVGLGLKVKADSVVFFVEFKC